MRSAFSHIPRFITTIICFVALLLVASLSPASAQPSPETWMDLSQDLTVEESWEVKREDINTIGPDTYRPSCTQGVYLKRNFSVGVALWLQTIAGCWGSSHLGHHTLGSSPWLATGYVAGRITNLGNTQQIQPIPKPGVLLETRRGSNSSSYTRFVYDAGIVTTKGLLGTVSHTYVARDVFPIAYENGRGVIPEGRGLNYSKNGRYAVGVNSTTAMFRIDLNERKILNFGLPIPHGAGWDPMMAISITDDGRYAVAAGTAHAGNQWIRIYDLTKCKDSEYTYLKDRHAGCEYRDITQFIKHNFADTGRFSMAEFGDDFTLFIYNIPTDVKKPAKRYMLRAPNAPNRASSYLALGDSYVSGEGVGNYFRGTDEGPKVNNCHLSKDSYPYLIGRHLKIHNYRSVACSGARIQNITGPEDTDNTLTRENRSNQFLQEGEVLKKAKIESSLRGWLPGYDLQRYFLKKNNFDTVTISMVGNDIGFADKVKRCLEPDTCYNTYEDRLEILREIRGKFNQLTDMYKTLLNEGNKNKRVYVIGYPKVGISTGSCALNVRLNAAELEFADLLVSELNKVIKQAASKAGVFYVDVEDAFLNHRFCENNSRLVALNGLTLGNDIAGVIGNESYHPNAIGHRLFANKILEQTKSFTEKMPAPNPSTIPSQQEDDLLFLNQPRSSRKIYSTNYYAGLSEDILYKNVSTQVKLEEDYRSGYKPYSLVGIFIYSEPIQVGSTNANEDGTIGTEITIPGSVKPGFHTLHLFGENIQNEPVNFYKTVYVAHSERDKNGNGIEDKDEPCGVFEASGTDYDQDGIDDACDPTISELPLETEDKLKTTKPNPTPKTASPDTATSTPINTLRRLSDSSNVLSTAQADFISSILLNPSAVRQQDDQANRNGPATNIWAIGSGIIIVTVLTIILGLRYSKQ